MLYLDVKSTDPSTNLALEEFVLRNSPAGENVFLLWQNANTVVIGRYQNLTEEVDTMYAAEHDIRIVRRSTGGGAVYHDLGNVNFSFISDCTDPQKLDFSVFSNLMAGALRQAGLDVQISGRNDMTVDGRKFSGSAQTVLNGRVLHHGTLLFRTDLARMQRVLTVSQEKLASKGVSSVRSRVTNLTEYLGEQAELEAFKAGLLDYFIKSEPSRQLELSEDDLCQIQRLRDEKYASKAWIYGRSPGYSVRKGKRFPAGKVDVFLETEKQGVIKSIAFQGDFFGSSEIDGLEQRLTGVQLSADGLSAALEQTNVEQYISGVSADELIQLLLG